jgi:hypothetical protein
MLDIIMDLQTTGSGCYHTYFETVDLQTSGYLEIGTKREEREQRVSIAVDYHWLPED